MRRAVVHWRLTGGRWPLVAGRQAGRRRAASTSPALFGARPSNPHVHPERVAPRLLVTCSSRAARAGIELEVAEDPASEEHFGISIAEGAQAAADGGRRQGGSGGRWSPAATRHAGARAPCHGPGPDRCVPLAVRSPASILLVVPAGMSAGVIPVVLNRGGVTDIVRHGVTGYLGSNAAQLANITKEARGLGGRCGGRGGLGSGVGWMATARWQRALYEASLTEFGRSSARCRQARASTTFPRCSCHAPAGVCA